MKPFGISVPGEPKPMSSELFDGAGWCVYLPHSCDEWVVAEGRTKDEAMNALDEFLAAGQAALSALRAAPEDTRAT